MRLVEEALKLEKQKTKKLKVKGEGSEIVT